MTAETDKPNRTRFLNSTFHQYLLQLAQYIFPFITIPYLTRVLGPDTYAIRAYVLAAMTFMQVFLNYGFNAYGTKKIAETEDTTKVNEITSAITVLRFLLCGIGLLIVLAATQLIPILKENFFYVLIAYLSTCFSTLLPDFIFQGKEEMKIITQRYVVSQFFAVVGILLFVKSPEQLLLVPAFECLASFIGVAWSWQNVFSVHKIKIVKVSYLLLSKSFKQSTIFFLSAASTVIFSSLTTLMIGLYISDPAQISFWSLSMMVITAIQSLYTPIENALYPHMIKRKDRSLAVRLLFAGSIASLFGTLLLTFLANPIMLIIGGEDYLPGSYVLAYTSPILFFSYIAIILGYPILAAVGKANLLTMSSVIASIFHIIGLLVLLLLNQFDIQYVALLRCATEAILAFLRTVFSFQYLRAPKQ